MNSLYPAEKYSFAIRIQKEGRALSRRAGVVGCNDVKGMKHHKSLDINSNPNPGSRAKTAAKPASERSPPCYASFLENH